MNKKELFSIPNLISYARILLMPLYVYITYQGNYLWSSFLLLFLAVTDFLDGYIARKYNMITEFGKLLDPVADKLFQIAIAVCLIFKIDGMWVIFIILMIKETILCICSSYYYLRYKRKMDGAMWCGKISTAVFYTMTFLMALLPPLQSHVYYFMETIMAITLIISFFVYNHFFWLLHKEIKAEKKARKV